MKCLINCSCDNTKWVSKYFPNVHPYLLKLINKPLLEYYVDFCVLNEITDIRIVSDHKLNYIENHFKNGAKWGVSITYSVSKPDDPIKSIVAKNKKFTIDNDLLVISGLIFIDYDVNKYEQFEVEKENHIISETLNGKLVLIPNGEKYSENKSVKNNFVLLPIMSIKEFFKVSMDIIEKKNSNFILPGYSNENDIFVGKNVVIPQNTIVEKYVMIGNNVNLSYGVIVGECSIIGDNVIIDDSTKISSSIIYDSTFIGSDLVFENKILYKNLLIDPLKEEKIKLTDDFLASDIASNSVSVSIYKFTHKVISLLILLIILVPYLLIRILLAPFVNLRKIKKESIISQDNKILNYTICIPKKINPINFLFFKFSLHKFSLLLEVLKGNLYLCGNSILENNLKNKKLLRDFKSYHPALFTYNDSVRGNDEMVRSLNDLYYSNNVSLWLDTKIILKCLTINLFSNIITE
ncbi:MAG: hypothetical protein GQ534_11170 [Candidatus Delongbacteria bacterium]|nr:hypothetical protein [Candidatus Delongbacteria bacterium]